MSTPTPFRWPLAIAPFTLRDKLAISRWLLVQDRYTMGERVAELEERFSEFSGAHALMTANGSVANQLVFELWKIKYPGIKPVVIVPAVTWISSISPALMAGCDIAFCDINLKDFSFDYAQAERLVKEHTAAGRHVILWPTALIGFSPDMRELHRIAGEHGADLYLDSCENTFSRVPKSPGDELREAEDQSILASADMTTTSMYNSHQVSSVEGGFVFFKDRDDYDLGRVFRNHGLTRSLPPEHPLRQRVEHDFPDVDPQFLFALAGTNMRPTDVHAMFGLADFKRIPQSIEHRNQIYRAFWEGMNDDHYYVPAPGTTHVGFCLPIFALDETMLPRVKQVLGDLGIEHRPIIGSNLLYQPVFQDFGHPWQFPNAEWVHRHGCYVGLHFGVTEDMVDQLTEALDTLARTHRKAA